jgi:hypothetical protein
MRLEVTCDCGLVNDLALDAMDLYDEYDCEDCEKIILIVDEELLKEREYFRFSEKNEKYL